MLPCHVRILLDYRPALKQRTGVGEYVHELARALAAALGQDELTLLSTPRKDRRPDAVRRDFPGIRIVDRRLPAQAVALAWNRLEWPPVGRLAGACDVAHALSPRLMPTVSAARLLTIHDLHVMTHTDQGEREPNVVFAGAVRESSRDDPAPAAAAAAAGLARAAHYTWKACAAATRLAYRAALDSRTERSR
jgi:hypothetical protein